MADDGAVTVCVRVRPLIERENAELGGKESMVWKSEKCSISQVDGTKSFTFDRVFHPEENTAEVYKEVADPIIKSAVQGYNGTIFAYGQTASGKTYTMLGTKSSPGILPMAIEDVFKTICGVPDREFLLRISYMEIHNETIKDLLCSNIRKKKPLVVREDISRNIYVEDLSEEVVISPEHVMSWLKKGEKNRHYGETKMNARSSRSHTIFRMIIESKEKSDASNSNCDGAVMVSHLNLVDLAGSERASQTGTDGIRLKEGCNINRSLFILAQVIKKLSDDPPGGFINYRDSKLTRILQNSLGGNAKTAIICTVTPVSLEETLSTFQFASTAKKMKNSPKVNEVLDDDALLKRYRREIEDLKRRLEEVSSDSHTRDEEKDQLAQLLEEKNSLQKQQEDRIRTLAKMVVTSSSFLQEQELKTRKKRRVTWTPGQINCNREIFSEDFPERAKRFKSSLSAVSEMEESMSSVFSEYDDHCLAVSATVPEEEWIPGPEMSLIHKDFADSVILCETLATERDTAVTKQQATQAELETLQVEKEQLSHEVKELTEKIETTEFMVLERETLREHEMQLMHEISSLSAVIANAEGYNQDLQANLKSKELQLKEREDKVTALEKQIIELNNLLEESRKTGSRNKDASPVGTSSQAMDEMKLSLSDAETVAMDAKKESAFLRSENLALKERMDQLLDDYNRMKKDTECYRSQLEAGKVMYKNMQSDLQKELQYYLQENTKLTSLLEGKVPEGNQSLVELDEKVLQLKNELDKALGENISLRKEVAALSEGCLKSDLEILHKEILEKSEMITSLASEREILLSQVAEKDQRLIEMTNTLKSKEDLANAEAVRENDEAVKKLKHLCQELRQELATVSEENKRMQDQLESLSGDNLKFNTAINEMAEELSSKVQELQAKDLEQEKLLCMEEELSHVRQELNNLEQLKEQLKAWESKVEAVEVERLAIVQRLQSREEEISALAQGRDELKQMLEEVQRERDQIKDDIEETVAMNIEAQNELRSSQHSLKQCQKDIKELQATLLKKESQTASIKEALETTINEQKLQILKLTEDLEQATLEKNQLSAREALPEENEVHLMREQILRLEEEKTKLQQQLETLQEEKDLSQESHQLKLASHLQDAQAKGVREEELMGVKAELVQALQKLSEMGEQLKASESRIEANKMVMAQELCNHEEAVRSLIEERDHLRHERDTLQVERDQVQEGMQATQLVLSSKIQELQDNRKEQEELLRMMKEQHSGGAEQSESDISSLKALESKLEATETEKLEMAERLQLGEEERKSLTLERDDWKQKWDAVQLEKEGLKELLKDTTLKLSSKIQELQDKGKEQEELLRMMKEQHSGGAEQSESDISSLKALESKLEATETEKLEMAERLQLGEEERKSLTLERDDWKQKWDAVQMEKEGLKELLKDTTLKNQSEMEGLTEQLRILESKLEDKEREKSEMAERLQDSDEERRSLVLELDDLKQKWDTVQTEKEKLKELLEGATSKLTSVGGLQARSAQEEELVIVKEELSQALQKLSEMEELREQLKAIERRMEVDKTAAAQELHEHEEAVRSLVQEKDDLRHQQDALQQERDQAQEEMRATQSMLSSKNQELEVAEREFLHMKEQLCSEAQQNQSEMERLTEQLKILESKLEAKEREKLEMAERLQDGEEERKSLVLERDDLKQTCDAVRSEKEKLKELLEETTTKGLELQEQLENAKGSLREYHSTVEELRGENCQALKVQEDLRQTTEWLKQKVVDTQAEVEKLLEKTKSQEQQVTRQEGLIAEQEEQLRKREAELTEEMAQLKEKLEQLTEKLSLQVAENNHLLAEQKAQAESMQQLGMENLMLKTERDSIQRAMENAKAENDQLRHSFLENTEKFSETNAKLEQDLHELKQQLEETRQEKTPESKEQDDLEKLQAKVSKIMEALQKLPMIEKRYEYLGRVALKLKTEVNNQKELATKVLEDVSCEKAKQIRRLQMEHEVIGSSVHRLLNKLQFLFTRLCKKKGEYYVNISNYTMELLGERRKQHELLTQIQSLKEPCGNSHSAVSQELCIPELNQNLDSYVEQIWKDVSQMEEEVHSIEVMLQQLESNDRTVKEYSVPFDVQDFETRIKQDSEMLLPKGRLLKPKAQVLMEMREELESRNANYCKETEATLKTCRERTRELLQALNTLKEHQVPSGHADLILEEENYRLESKLKAQDQDMQDLKVKIQELENAANGARKKLLEKEQRIAVLEMELKVRASKSEVLRLRTALEEKENCLTNTLTENQTLKAQLSKGAELYKEEIEDLKMQLAKADMALMKQSKWFDREMTNAKALAEHKEEQLRKLREDLRRAQLEQDATIMPSQDIPQPPLSITCGGGSGIVQNTQMLVLKSEHVKLEREVIRLKKEHELVLKSELHLKEEVKKWKERVLKMREQSRVMSEEKRLKSPRKTAPPSLADLPPPPKECSLLPAPALDRPTTFFDNSRLGSFNDEKPAGGASPEKAPSEDSLKHWIAKTNKEGTPQCKTQ
ncbi:PREDICTED: centromere-associated protein E [Gekko japonicus]|uniref:Centromere-associated protein E n=1 Tax=Gekko japonicus TaxID=146911 RepID=A0ABM1JIG4_GEKJA|nr:PREDICTED: centromere-associated protein E [Gekko japonicus]